MSQTTNANDLTKAAGELTGLQQLQVMLDGDFPPPAIGNTLDFMLASAEYGKVSFEGVPSEKHLNPIGVVHGGYAATLLDSALGCSVHTMLEPGQGYTTIDLNIKYIRAMVPGMGKVFATAEVVHKGRKFATAEGRLVDENGKLYATGTTTCAIL